MFVKVWEFASEHHYNHGLLVMPRRDFLGIRDHELFVVHMNAEDMLRVQQWNQWLRQGGDPRVLEEKAEHGDLAGRGGDDVDVIPWAAIARIQAIPARLQLDNLYRHFGPIIPTLGIQRHRGNRFDIVYRTSNGPAKLPFFFDSFETGWQTMRELLHVLSRPHREEMRPISLMSAIGWPVSAALATLASTGALVWYFNAAQSGEANGLMVGTLALISCGIALFGLAIAGVLLLIAARRIQHRPTLWILEVTG